MELTDEQIIAIAKEFFGCEEYCMSGKGERDREVTVEEYPIGELAIQFARAILLHERERCAKVCEQRASGERSEFGAGYDSATEDCAAAIRKGN